MMQSQESSRVAWGVEKAEILKTHINEATSSKNQVDASAAASKDTSKIDQLQGELDRVKLSSKETLAQLKQKHSEQQPMQINGAAAAG